MINRRIVRYLAFVRSATASGQASGASTFFFLLFFFFFFFFFFLKYPSPRFVCQRARKEHFYDASSGRYARILR